MTFANKEFIWLIGLVCTLLCLLSFLSWPRQNRKGLVAPIAISLRVLGILLTGFILLDPQKATQVPNPEENRIAILADNSESLELLNPDGQTRGDFLKKILTASETNWLPLLDETFSISNFSFDRSVNRIGSFATLGFDGTQSSLRSSLMRFSRQDNANPPAAILLFSDGISSDGWPDESELSRLPPVFAVSIASTTGSHDLALPQLAVSQSPFEFAPIQVSGTAQKYGSVRDSQATLRLRPLNQENADTVESIIRFDQNNDASAFQLEWPQSSPGTHFFELSIREEETADQSQPSRSEATLQNNRRLFVSDGGQETFRILYVAGRPNWEFKFMNRALFEDKHVELVGLIRIADREPKFEFKGRRGESSNPLFRGFGREDETERYDQAVTIRINTRDEQELSTGFPDTPQELFEYDAIIIDDLEAEFFSYHQQGLIREFVSRRGGGLLMLGGASALEDGGYESSALVSALPVALDATAFDSVPLKPVRWQLNREGWVQPWLRLSKFESEEQRIHESMPNFNVLNFFPRLRPGAQTLASVEDDQGKTYPAMVVRNFGAGRVACLAVGDFWLWGMQGQNQRAHLERFWRQVSRWLVSNNPTRFDLTATVQEDGAVRLDAHSLGEDYLPLSGVRAEVTIEQVDRNRKGSEGAHAVSVTLQSDPEQAGHFSRNLHFPGEGAYLAKLSVLSQSGERIGEAQAGWVSEPNLTEFGQLDPQNQQLRSIAEATGGRLLQIADLDDLPDLISRGPATKTTTIFVSLWHNALFLLLPLACFLAEWALRKRKGLA